MAHGVPARVVSHNLGHSEVSVTLSTYSYVRPAMLSDAAKAMDRALSR